MFLQMQHFCFPDLGKEKLCSILVFENACFNVIVRINHDNVPSRGAVGRTHIIVRFQTRIVEKLERRISGVSYMCWMDFHNAILCCGFLCTLLISFYFTATTPRATTPHLYHHGLSRLCMHPGYHAIVYIYS